jgi:predicted double-glycine peptidase
MGAVVIAAIFAVIVSFTSSIYPLQDQPKSEINLTVPGPAGHIRTYVNPLSEIKKEHFIKQGFDFSCGSAALAMLLNFYLGEKFTEKQVMQGLLHYGDIDQIKKRQAFSLLDMKRFVKVLGYEGEGWKVDIEDFKDIDKPCIIPIKIFNYRHFVVFKGIYKGHVFVTDPWRGDISFTVDEFYERMYEKAIFIVSKDKGPVLNGLRLTKDDLNFIDEDAAREIIFDHTNPSATAAAEREFKQIVDVPGKYQYYRAKK